jgi:hypothetical protein
LPAPPARQPADYLRSQPRAVLVAAAGGGIQAAAWTAKVLGGLSADDERFAPAVQLVSAVSGGSVGALYYLQARAGVLGAPEGASQYDWAFAQAVQPSLDAVAWGLVTKDLWNAIWPWRRDLLRDRGWALERTFTQRMALRGALLSSWQGDRFPAVLFNATVVETGEPLVFSNHAFPTPESRMRNFQRDYGRDLEVATAARVSASFPFVTPVARPLLDSAAPSAHLADGGYFDNFGLIALIEWLRAAARAATHPLPDILVLRIVPFPGDRTPRLAPRSWSYQAWAPLQTMLSVRNTAQEVRGEVELALLRQQVPRLTEVAFRYSPVGGCEEPSLSWNLTAGEIECLRAAWQAHPCREAVRRFLDGSGLGESPC